jgi:hypothetical protein
LLLAKAYRHLGVIDTATKGALSESNFENAKLLLKGIRHDVPVEVQSDNAHIAHAEALAIVSMLGVNQSGALRRGDVAGEEALRKGLKLVREARDGFKSVGDQGRFAKSLVLEVRILEALNETIEAKQVSLVRDRVVAGSVWARPDGAAYITGR